MQRSNTVLMTALILSEFMVTGMISSCKKGDEAKPGKAGDTTSVLTGQEEDSLKYLMYQIMQVSFVDGGRDQSSDLPTYYWYNQVPKLNPLGPQYSQAEDLLSTIQTYPKVNGAVVDRYSFLDRTGGVANQIQNGVVDGVFSGLTNTGDFGLQASYTTDGNLWVLYTDKNSPAGLKGIQRGWQITAVNGNSSVAYDGPNGTNVTRVEQAIYSSSEIELTFKKSDNTSVTYTLNSATYEVNPVIFDTVYTRNTKKIGYFVLYTFSSVENDQGGSTHTKAVLDKEFGKLQAAGINDLIVDLRYNGGGAVTTAEYLDSAIAPAAAKGKLMYTYLYNDKLTQNAWMLGLSSSVNFPGGGGLNLDHVFFIVTRSTASASELTLNNLKPYMDVKLVGDTTYGKPVGFIDFTITADDSTGQQQYLADLYAIDFATQNANGVGGYYNGILPDEPATDYVNVPWGNPNDDNLNKIFNFITTGSFARSAENQRLSAPVGLRLSGSGNLPIHQFNGMIDYRLSRQLKQGRDNLGGNR